MPVEGDVVTMPSGATARLQDEESMTNGQRKPLVRAFMKLMESGAATINEAQDEVDMHLDKLDSEDIFELTETTIAALVVEWSFDKVLPSADRTVLDDISAKDYDELQRACMERFDGMTLGVDPTTPSSTST